MSHRLTATHIGPRGLGRKSFEEVLEDWNQPLSGNASKLRRPGGSWILIVLVDPFQVQAMSCTKILFSEALDEKRRQKIWTDLDRRSAKYVRVFQCVSSIAPAQRPQTCRKNACVSGALGRRSLAARQPVNNILQDLRSDLLRSQNEVT